MTTILTVTTTVQVAGEPSEAACEREYQRCLYLPVIQAKERLRKIAIRLSIAAKQEKEQFRSSAVKVKIETGGKG